MGDLTDNCGEQYGQMSRKISLLFGVHAHQPAGNRPVTMTAAPHHTVSRSEDGFETIMQAVTLRVSMGRQDAGMFMLSLTVDALDA